MTSEATGNRKEIDLKAQVAALEQLLEVHEMTVLEQSKHLEQTLEDLNDVRLELEERVAERTAALLSANKFLNDEIVERRKTEKRLQNALETTNSILELMPAGVVIIDDKKIIRRANKTALQMMGKTVDEVCDHVCHGLMCPAQEGQCPVWDLGSTVNNSERVLLGPAGAKIPILKSGIPIVMNDEDVLLEVFLDISDRKEMEERLIEARKVAEMASKAKSEFLATMSHEIRTPMNAIIGFTDMLLGTKLSAEQQEFVQAVNHGGESLLGLINDILDFSKIEARKLEVENIEFNLQELISRVGVVNKGRVEEKGLEFEQSVPTLDLLLVSDPARLQQILTNIISNATKFTSQGRITLEVRMKEEAEETITLDFAVTDTGIGIPTERQTSIFEAFTQADGSVTRKYGGTGLGLTIANQLVGLLGGTTLKVQSREGAGSTFSFELPFMLGSKIGSETDKAEKAGKQSEEIQSCRILLVEDDMINITLVTMLLEEQGHLVTVAENGLLGVEAAFKDEYDIILMDMMMPEMDGLEATREIRRREKESTVDKKQVPIIAITANAMKGDREKCIEAGMDDYLTKPIKIELLNQVIGQCLDDHKKEGGRLVAAEAECIKTMLVVDDNMVNCKLLMAGLQKVGYRVLLAHDGQQAVNTYEQESIDGILMDIQMPIMDGLEATRKIRALEAENPERDKIPIIAITAHASIDECLAAGMDLGYKKPTKIAELVVVIENLLKS
jgi:two-component system, sensor histidine kinase and response regulator